jgi:hypothetical protein
LKVLLLQRTILRKPTREATEGNFFIIPGSGGVGLKSAGLYLRSTGAFLALAYFKLNLLAFIE